MISILIRLGVVAIITYSVGLFWPPKQWLTETGKSPLGLILEHRIL